MFTERQIQFVSFLATCRAQNVSEDETIELLIQRFGPMLHEEIGLVIGCSRERSRQLEESGLRKLRLRQEMREYRS